MPNNHIDFGVDLLPSSDLGFNLGTSNKKWNIFGNVTGNATTISISEDTTTNKNYAVVFGTTPSDGTSPTAAKTEGLQKNSAKLQFNPSSGNLSSTKFNNLTLTASTDTGFTISGGSTSKTLTVNESITLKAGTSTYVAYYNGNNILQGHALAHFNDVANGKNELVLGSSTTNVFGQLALYSTGSKGTYLTAADNSTSSWVTATLPAITGVLAILKSSTAKGSDTIPVKVAATGEIQECSTYAGGTAVTLNGAGKGASTASFYAPTEAGTSGYVLKSQGSGEPGWEQEYTVEILQL